MSRRWSSSPSSPCWSSNLAARVRAQALSAQARARTTEALYAFSRKLASAGTLDDVLWATAYQIAFMLRVRVVLLLPDDGVISVKAGYPPEDRLDEADLAAAKWAFERDHPAGRGADTLPGGKRLFLPMHTGRGTIGVVGLDSDKPGPLLTPEQRRLFDALSDQAALAIERVRLVEDLDKAKLAVATDRLRSALLTSISHDLKTPLAAIFGAASTLHDFANALDDAAKADLLVTIVEESERLNRFIANLLDMTRLESGAIAPNLNLYDISEIVGTALQRASKILSQHRIDVALAADLPMLKLDAVLFEQVLFNLFDNAAKHAPPGTTVRLQGWLDKDWVYLAVADEGTGIPASRDRPHLREVLSRREGRPRSRRHGTGACHLARLRRSHGRWNRRGQPCRPAGGAVHHFSAGAGRGEIHGGGGMSTAPTRILIVDDEPPIRKLLRMGLGTQGYQVLEAPNGKAALGLMAEAPDIIILDLGLPDMPGLDLLRQLRGQDAAIPIVVLSSRGDEAGKVQALDLGADDYLTKPFGMNELMARLRAALRHRLQSQGERPVFAVGDLAVDLVRRIVKVRGVEVKLSRREYELSAGAGAACRQGADAPVPAAGSLGRGDATRSICASTSASYARSSNPSPTGRITS